MSHLRRIAVYVDEPTPGAFVWALLERFEDVPAMWIDLERSSHTFNSWITAFEAAAIALMGMVHNGLAGPPARSVTHGVMQGGTG